MSRWSSQAYDALKALKTLQVPKLRFRAFRSQTKSQSQGLILIFFNNIARKPLDTPRYTHLQGDPTLASLTLSPTIERQQALVLAASIAGRRLRMARIPVFTRSARVKIRGEA